MTPIFAMQKHLNDTPEKPRSSNSN